MAWQVSVCGADEPQPNVQRSFSAPSSSLPLSMAVRVFSLLPVFEISFASFFSPPSPPHRAMHIGCPA
jgi:hypothetical protein